MDILYQNTGDFHDVTGGTSTGNPNYSAGVGYDYVTGLGSPIVPSVFGSLDGTSSTPTSSDTLAVSAPTAATAGNSFSVTVTADNAQGAVDTGYTGTVALTSSDVQAGLPASYTFTAADAGKHTFTVTLKTAGTQTITATDTSGSAVAKTSSGIAVSPAAASEFVISGLASSTTVGASQSFTVTAKDVYGNVATGYTGTVSFSSSDAKATLPSSYTFSAANAGSHTFSIGFATAGSQSVTVGATGIKATQSGINVAPAAPISLTAKAASASQIDLTWVPRPAPPAT